MTGSPTAPSGGAHEQFGQLRSLTHGAPDREAWATLVALFEALPRDERAPLVQYAADTLRRWPARLRCVPTRWLEDERAWDLLTLGAWMNLTTPHPTLGDALASGALRNIEGVWLHGAEVMRDPLREGGALRTLWSSPHAPGLHTLALRTRASCWALLAEPCALPLRTLDLSGHTDDGFGWFQHAQPIDTLRTLRLAGCAINPIALHHLPDGPLLQTVRTLDLTHVPLSIPHALTLMDRLHHATTLRLHRALHDPLATQAPAHLRLIPDTRRLVLRAARSPLGLRFLAETIEETRPLVQVGRHPTQDVTLVDATLSSRHALLYWLGDEVFVADRNTSNGTWLNGARVDTPAPLREGDELSFSRISFHVRGIERPEPDAHPLR